MSRSFQAGNPEANFYERSLFLPPPLAASLVVDDVVLLRTPSPPLGPLFICARAEEGISMRCFVRAHEKAPRTAGGRRPIVDERAPRVEGAFSSPLRRRRRRQRECTGCVY